MIMSSVVELRNQYADVDYECSLSQRTGERPLVRNVPDLLANWPGGLKPKTAAERTSSDADANTAGMLQLRYVWGFGYTPLSDVRT